MTDAELSEFDKESTKFYGQPLHGKYKHFCADFDYLPIDENCYEFKYCTCFKTLQHDKRELENM